MSRFDIAIIGTGPAGLSAALTARARNKNFILFGNSRLSDKINKAHMISNYLGLPDISGDEMQKIFLDQINKKSIKITEQKVTLIYPMDNYFSIQAGTKIYEASSVILASGMVSANTIPGEDNFLGRGVSYCATCDAAFFKEKKVVLIGYSKEAEDEAIFIKEYASEVIYIPMYKDFDENIFNKSNISILHCNPREIQGGLKADTLVTDKDEIKTDGVFIIRESISPGKLIPGLEMSGNHIEVSRDMSTNITGVFAAGDITGTPYQYMKSAGEGNVAALSAVSYLTKLN